MNTTRTATTRPPVVVSIAGVKRYGKVIDRRLKLRCACDKLFTAGQAAYNQGLVKCCDECLFELSDSGAVVRAPQPPSCRFEARRAS